LECNPSYRIVTVSGNPLWRMGHELYLLEEGRLLPPWRTRKTRETRTPLYQRPAWISNNAGNGINHTFLTQTSYRAGGHLPAGIYASQIDTQSAPSRGYARLGGSGRSEPNRRETTKLENLKLRLFEFESTSINHNCALSHPPRKSTSEASFGTLNGFSEPNTATSHGPGVGHFNSEG
jgi:hypothetical protein